MKLRLPRNKLSDHLGIFPVHKSKGTVIVQVQDRMIMKLSISFPSSDNISVNLSLYNSHYHIQPHKNCTWNIHYYTNLQSIPTYENEIIFGQKWFSTEWKPSRQLVWAIGEACMMLFTSLLSVNAATTFSYTTESRKVNRYL